VETAECWLLALQDKDRPSLIALTRQNVEQVRLGYDAENRSARGAYELLPAAGEAQVSLFATGSEVGIAVAARDRLQAEGIGVRVVSVPSFELFAGQDEAYRSKTLGTAPVRIGIEAAVRQGWDALIGADGTFVGMRGFGASGPYEALYKEFGITADIVVAQARERLAETGVGSKPQESKRRSG
jgi:transketolase